MVDPSQLVEWVGSIRMATMVVMEVSDSVVMVALHLVVVLEVVVSTEVVGESLIPAEEEDLPIAMVIAAPCLSIQLLLFTVTEKSPYHIHIILLSCLQLHLRLLQP